MFTHLCLSGAHHVTRVSEGRFSLHTPVSEGSFSLHASVGRCMKGVSPFTRFCLKGVYPFTRFCLKGVSPFTRFCLTGVSPFTHLCMNDVLTSRVCIEREFHLVYHYIHPCVCAWHPQDRGMRREREDAFSQATCTAWRRVCAHYSFPRLISRCDPPLFPPTLCLRPLPSCPMRFVASVQQPLQSYLRSKGDASSASQHRPSMRISMCGRISRGDIYARHVKTCARDFYF